MQQENNENNAAILTGARGSGKSVTLRRTLQRLKKAHRDTGLTWAEVHLNGHLQRSDSLAMVEICTQLRDHPCFKDEVGVVSSFSDNLDTLTKILERSKQRRGSQGIPLIFILDEFDLFALRPKQTLLYNLCDLLQMNLSPVAIVGTTCRMNAYNMLEKRVRSRILYRDILFPPVQQNLNTLINTTRDILSLDEDSAIDEGERAAIREHNEKVDKLLLQKELHNYMRIRLYEGKQLGWFFSVWMMNFSNMRRASFFPEPKTFYRCANYLSRSWPLESLQDLSVLELSLIASMMKLEHHCLVPYNFELAFDQYSAYQATRRFESIDFFTKPVCLKAFGHLIDLQIIQVLQL